MIKYKTMPLEELKKHGYSANWIRSQNIMGSAMIQKIRTGGLPSWSTLDTICRLTGLQPGDLLEYIPDDIQNDNTTR